MKTCSKCKIEKPVTEFHKDTSRKSGLQPQCKICKRELEKSRKNAKEYRRQWYQAHRQEVIQMVKDYATTNAESVGEYKHRHYEQNAQAYKERAKTNYRLRYENDPETCKIKNNTKAREWRLKNKHIGAWRNLLHRCLLQMGKKKTGKTRDILKYAAVDLKNHLEALWLPGMSWGNYGEWHIDHEKPICTFHPDTDPAIVNALFNLRPLWA